MWESSLKGSEFCLVRGASSGIEEFRPCLDNILLPGIFLCYILLWYFIDIGFFTKQFWIKIGKSVKNGFGKIANIGKFFLSCFSSKRQLPSEASRWDLDGETEGIQIEDNQEIANANFINPKCGNCDRCLQNAVCPMKTWNELRRLKVWGKPFEFVAVVVGFAALVFDIFLVLLPDNKYPNADDEDSALKTLISIAPEWSMATHLAMQAIISILIAALIGRQMNRVPENGVSARSNAYFAIHITSYAALLSIALIPSVVTVIDDWTELPGRTDVPISVFWTALLVFVWLLLVLCAIGMIYICIQIVNRYRALTKLSNSGTMPLQHKTSTQSIELGTLSPTKDSSWVFPQTDISDGCGCGCCSSTGTFRIDRNPPEYRANFWSRLTFGWISPLIALGYARPLDIEDLTAVPGSLEAQKVELKFVQLWKEELTKRGVEAASLMRVCFKFSKIPLLKSAAYKIVYDTLSFAGPLILNILIKYLDKCEALYDDSRSSERSFIGTLFLEGIGIVVLLFVINVTMTLFLHQYFHEQFKTGMSTRAALVGFIYSKALKISSGATKGQLEGKSEASSDITADTETEPLNETNDNKKGCRKNKKKKKEEDSKQATTTGEVVNLMAVDAQRMQEMMPYIHLLWSSPYQIVLALILLWRELGPSMLSGVAVMAVSIPVTAILGKKIKNRQKSLMSLRDDRIKITNEVFAGMKIIKVYAWEESFRKKVVGVRDNELGGLWKYSLLTMGQRILWTAVPAFVSLVSFLTYVAVGNQLTAAKAFTSIALFNLLRFPLNVFPMMISLVTESLVALTRIRNFVIRPEVSELPDPPSTPMNNPNEATVVAKNLSLRWPNGTPAIDRATFSCKPGAVTAIIGKTGSGKTALLASIIGDLLPEATVFNSQEASSLSVNGRLAYVAQTAWIINATLRENILFGRPFNPHWYAKVIRACALKPDLDILPAGDMTEIGEKGVNLSGGQKQRVSLARAVYQCGTFPVTTPSELPADIYILDDCLSAVDSHVGQHIFEKCIMGLLREMKRTVVFVTHKVDILPRVDNIVFLGREPLSDDVKGQTVGRVTAMGSHEELLSNPSYVNFTEEARTQEEEEEKHRLDEEKSEVAIVPTVVRHVSQEDVELNESRSFMEREAVEGGRSSMPADVRRGSLSNGKLRKESTGLNDLVLEFKSEQQDGKKPKGGLTDKENLAQGAVGAYVYWAYFQGVGGPPVLILILISLALSQGSQVASNSWISYWSDHADTIPGLPTGILVYSALSVLQILLYALTAFSVILASQKASRYFHEGLITRLLRAPMAFFDATPLGRIINRFSKDLYTIDVTLPQTMNMYITNLFSVIATFAVIIVATPWFAAICIPLLGIYGYVQNYYIPCSRQLQRVDSVLRSPIFAHFSETLDGVPTIRAYRAQDRFKLMNTDKLDSQQRAYYLLIASNRWLAVRLEFVGTMVVMFSSLLAVFGGLKGSISPGIGGLAISYALNITQSLNWMVRMTSDRESNIVSVERVQEYSEKIPEEAPAVVEAHRPPEAWPDKGSIRFNGYQLRYRPKLPLVLKGLDLQIAPEEKIGIVGRTGAGKSTLLIGLLRLVEPAGGLISVDGLDIGEMGLFDLRSKFSIIPQDPVLFTGTLRFNLDPFDTRTDAEIWQALERSHLKLFVEKDFPGGLSGQVEEGGKNLSMGQKQLICLARALLRRSKILLLDEATSAVDPLTDRLIQQTIREEFSNCSILTIAHRIGTILDYDKILVLDAGVAVEFGPPSELLNKRGGVFRSLCIDGGIVVEDKDDQRSSDSSSAKEKTD